MFLLVAVEKSLPIQSHFRSAPCPSSTTVVKSRVFVPHISKRVHSEVRDGSGVEIRSKNWGFRGGCTCSPFNSLIHVLDKGCMISSHLKPPWFMYWPTSFEAFCTACSSRDFLLRSEHVSALYGIFSMHCVSRRSHFFLL